MQHALLDVIGDFYDCAIEPALWPAAFEKAAALIGNAGGSYFNSRRRGQ